MMIRINSLTNVSSLSGFDETSRLLFLVILLVLFALSAYGQVDSTKMKKKEDPIALRGMVADGFTKAAIRDVKVTLMRADSTVVDTMRVWESYSYSSGIGKSIGTTNYHFAINRESARYILRFEHPNYETAFADFEMKQVGRRRQEIEGPKVYLKKAAHAHQIHSSGTMGHQATWLRPSRAGVQSPLQHQCPGPHRNMDELHAPLRPAHHQLPFLAEAQERQVKTE